MLRGGVGGVEGGVMVGRAGEVGPWKMVTGFRCRGSGRMENESVRLCGKGMMRSKEASRG